MAPEGPVFALTSYASAAIHAGKRHVMPQAHKSFETVSKKKDMVKQPYPFLFVVRVLNSLILLKSDVKSRLCEVELLNI